MNALSTRTVFLDVKVERDSQRLEVDCVDIGCITISFWNCIVLC